MSGKLNPGAVDGYLPSFRPEDTNGHYNELAYLIQAFMASINVATLVRVVAVPDPGFDVNPARTVAVQPLVSMMDGNGRAIDHGTVYNLPFIRVQGGGAALVVDPKVGDIGLAIFCDRDISGAKRGSQKAVPGSGRRFSMSDGIYLGGWGNLSAPNTYIELLDSGTVAVQAGTAVALSTPVLRMPDSGANLEIEGRTVVKKQQPTVTAPAGGGTVDAQARLAINDLIARLQAHGLIA